MSVWDEAVLRLEADYFHRALFGAPAPGIVAGRYVQLHHVCFPNPDLTEKETTERIVRLRLDVEAIECAFRLRGRRHLLSQKLHALLYLVEVRREYYPLFFNDNPAPIAGKLRLLRAIVRGVSKAVAGNLLIRRLRLA